jgi:hypothetical protein
MAENMVPGTTAAAGSPASTPSTTPAPLGGIVASIVFRAFCGSDLLQGFSAERFLNIFLCLQLKDPRDALFCLQISIKDQKWVWFKLK